MAPKYLPCVIGKVVALSQLTSSLGFIADFMYANAMFEWREGGLILLVRAIWLDILRVLVAVYFIEIKEGPRRMER